MVFVQVNYKVNDSECRCLEHGTKEIKVCRKKEEPVRQNGHNPVTWSLGTQCTKTTPVYSKDQGTKTYSWEEKSIGTNRN